MKNRLFKTISLCALLGAGVVTFTTAQNYSSDDRPTIAASTDDLARVMASWTLPAELREVSGIALLDDGLMACVQDEEGAIYLYDLEQKAVTGKIPFAGPGDYEGIVLHQNTAYILRSDGAVLEVKDFRSGKPAVTEHASILPISQNTEGLALDEKNNRLLIACKGYDEKFGPVKTIFALPLDSKQMQETPAIIIPLAQEQLKTTSGKKKDPYAVLQPSSLEIHPQTGELYLLDAVNHRLLVINEQGTIQKTVELDKDLFRQAEGLSFGPNGEMYIASEGSKKGSGVIVKYGKGI
ncbi:SdiA-regulated domain-containing protein [Pontibacter sp. Tf4]|uniref:SdiA-regulated domain-containing protein n=1 Tax=Pontibacter sp. Tf4 TaxID=2761620 RepID=UPI001627C74A|nr:SdiA-regulated domain-containing protein [Pontibacter sp. Tf4]MBB6612679.1 SdiA-regulated domain-containing protein [Pontibacter sp. Tf4]